MTRDDDPGRAGPVASRSGADELDPLLVRAFGAAFDRELPVDVEARHLWQLYRSARPSVIDGLSAAPNPGRLQRVLARVAITAMVTLVPSVLAAASADALPGDVLYAVKRHHQLAQVELAISWTERDAALAELAELRLDEARQVAVSRPRAAARVVADAAAALEELERSPLPTGSLQARRMRDEATREVAALLGDVPDPDRRHLQVAFDELSDNAHSPRVASAQLSPGADDQRSTTLRRRQSREPNAPDAARPAAPGTPGPAVDDRQLLARAPDDGPNAASPEPTAAPAASRPATAPADAVATAPRPAGTAPAAMAPTAPPTRQPVATESATEDPPPTTEQPPSEPDSTPTVEPDTTPTVEPEPSDAEHAGRPSWALPRSPSPAPKPTVTSSPAPSAEPTPAKSPASSADPTAPHPSEQPTKTAAPATKTATKAWRSGTAGRGPLVPSDAPAATEAP